MEMSEKPAPYYMFHQNPDTSTSSSGRSLDLNDQWGKGNFEFGDGKWLHISSLIPPRPIVSLRNTTGLNGEDFVAYLKMHEPWKYQILFSEVVGPIKWSNRQDPVLEQADVQLEGAPFAPPISMPVFGKDLVIYQDVRDTWGRNVKQIKVTACKQYASLSFRQLVNTIQTFRETEEGACFYELIRVHIPTKLYFDCELDYEEMGKTLPGLHNLFNGFLFGELFKKELRNFLITHVSQLFENEKATPIIWLDASVAGKKWSSHFIVQAPCINSSHVCSLAWDFYNYIRTKYPAPGPPVIDGLSGTISIPNIFFPYLSPDKETNGTRYVCVMDMGVYTKNRLFRMAGCCKGGSKRYFVPVLSTDTPESVLARRESGYIPTISDLLRTCTQDPIFNLEWLRYYGKFIANPACGVEGGADMDETQMITAEYYSKWDLPFKGISRCLSRQEPKFSLEKLPSANQVECQKPSSSSSSSSSLSLDDSSLVANCVLEGTDGFSETCSLFTSRNPIKQIIETNPSKQNVHRILDVTLAGCLASILLERHRTLVFDSKLPIKHQNIDGLSEHDQYISLTDKSLEQIVARDDTGRPAPTKAAVAFFETSVMKTRVVTKMEAHLLLTQLDIPSPSSAFSWNVGSVPRGFATVAPCSDFGLYRWISTATIFPGQIAHSHWRERKDPLVPCNTASFSALKMKEYVKESVRELLTQQNRPSSSIRSHIYGPTAVEIEDFSKNVSYQHSDLNSFGELARAIIHTMFPNAGRYGGNSGKPSFLMSGVNLNLITLRSNTHYCYSAQREHKGTPTYFVVNLTRQTIEQRCFTSGCLSGRKGAKGGAWPTYCFSDIHISSVYPNLEIGHKAFSHATGVTSAAKDIASHVSPGEVFQVLRLIILGSETSSLSKGSNDVLQNPYAYPTMNLVNALAWDGMSALRHATSERIKHLKTKATTKERPAKRIESLDRFHHHLKRFDTLSFAESRKRSRTKLLDALVLNIHLHEVEPELVEEAFPEAPCSFRSLFLPTSLETGVGARTAPIFTEETEVEENRYVEQIEDWLDSFDCFPSGYSRMSIRGNEVWDDEYYISAGTDFRAEGDSEGKFGSGEDDPMDIV